MRLRRPLKYLLITCIVMTGLIGLTFGAFGLVVAHVPQYRVQLQQWLSDRTGLVVEFRSLTARLHLYGPELVFDDAVVRTPDRTRIIATARRGTVGFDLWASLGDGRLTAGRFSLESPEIGLIRTREGRIQLIGQSALKTDDKPFAIEKLPTGRFDVKDAVVSFRDEITGRGPWSLSGVSFRLTRGSTMLELEGDASLPHALGQKIEFSASVAGALEKPADVVGKFKLGAAELDLAGWQDVLPNQWPAPETGRGSLQLSGTVHGPDLVDLAAVVDLQNFAAVLPTWATPLPRAAPMMPPSVAGDADDDPSDDTPVVEQTPPAAEPTEPPAMASFDRAAFSLAAKLVDDSWTFEVKDLDLSRRESAWRAPAITGHWRSQASERGLAVGVNLDRLVLENVWPLLAYLPESDALARIRALAAHGTLDDVSFELERQRADTSPRYAFDAKFTNIGIAPVALSPGFSGASGTVHATQDGGRAVLASRTPTFNLPRLFREPLAADTLYGALAWQRSEAGWVLTSDSLRVSNADGRVEARLAARIPGNGLSPTIELTAQARELRASSAHRYLPAGRLNPKTLEWLDRAFVDGRVSTADLTLRGPLRSFPFRKNEGLFLIRARAEGVRFDYQPGWTPATDVVADLEFRNQGMTIRAQQARVNELAITAASARIPDFRGTELTIDAAAQGDLQAGLTFLKASPLGPRLGEPFAKLAGAGPIVASVRLFLPMRHMDDRRIDVTTKFANATASLEGLSAPMTALTGTLTVRNTLVAAADLEAEWLGGPVEVAIRPESGSRSTSLLTVRGHAAGEALQEMLHLPPAARLMGATQWRASTVLRSSGAASPIGTVRIDSDLRGLAVAVPAPVGKAAEESKPLHVDLEYDGTSVMLARASLGDVRTLARLQRTSSGWGLDRGTIRADAVTAALPDHRGLRIEGAIERFVLDDWLALKGPGPAGGAASGARLSDYLVAANVRIAEFRLFGYTWPDVRGMLQTGAGEWRVDVDGPNAVGQVTIPTDLAGVDPLKLVLERLVLTRAATEGDAQARGTQTDPRSVPALDVHIGELRIDKRAIGRVDLKASRVTQGLRIESVTINGDAVEARAHGEWLNTVDGPRSTLVADIVSTDVSATLRSLDYTPFIEAKRGELHADIAFPGGFDQDLLGRASGSLALHGENGQLVSVQPGAGRVLGLFSVGALPRRLALDFSDLTDKGLSFDTVHGDFELKNGNAHTTNLLLRGPAVEIGVAGRTGLGARDYDQTAVVTGNLGASLPVAGALAGGPVVGAAVLLFSQVFKEPLKGITRGYYRITGTWDNPVVERVDAASVKDTAASAQTAQ